MPGAHSYTIQLNTLTFTLTMAQDQWTLQGEKQKSQTVHGPPLQARVVAANRAVLATCTTILAHMVMNRGRGNAEQNEAK